MRAVRTIASSLAMALFAAPCWAHDPEELGHHWYIPKYRTEMVTQTMIMAAVALAVVATLWLVGVVKSRRARG